MPRRKRTSKRTPSRAVRRASTTRPPIGAVVLMARMIRARLDRLAAEVERLVIAVLPDPAGLGVASSPEDEDAKPRVDAAPDYIRRRLSAVELRLGEIFDPEALGPELELIGKRVSRKNRDELQRAAGIKIREADAAVGGQIERFRAVNVSRIKSLAGEQLIRITNTLESAEASGMRVETLAKLIREQFDVSKGKAALLARDQTLKLNSEITRNRMQNAGVKEYVWTTSGDEAVRPGHADLDGTRQRWDTPPVVDERTGRRAHPGEDYQCRCTPFPVIEELEGLGLPEGSE